MSELYPIREIHPNIGECQENKLVKEGTRIDAFDRCISQIHLDFYINVWENWVHNDIVVDVHDQNLMSNIYIDVIENHIGNELYVSVQDNADKGVLITAVHANSLAEQQGFQPNDVILAINGKSVEDEQDYQQNLNSPHMCQSPLKSRCSPFLDRHRIKGFWKSAAIFLPPYPPPCRIP